MRNSVAGAALAFLLAAASLFSFSSGESVHGGVYESVVESAYCVSGSVPEAVYGCDSVPEAVYKTIQPDVAVQNPAPFYIRAGQGAVEAVVTAETTVELFLTSVENVPDTVCLAVYAEGVAVGEARGNQVMRTIPFLVQGSRTVEIRLAGKGRLNEAKLNFAEKLL
jgi:hypothetical protein